MMKTKIFVVVLLAIVVGLGACRRRSSDRDILTFSTPYIHPVTGANETMNWNVDQNNRTIVSERFFPKGTALNLVPTITHSGVEIRPASGERQNFANPVEYTVTAEDGSTKVYTATATVATE